MKHKKIACIAVVILILFSFCVAKNKEKESKKLVEEVSKSEQIKEKTETISAEEIAETEVTATRASESIESEKRRESITELCISCHGNGDIAFVKSFHYPAKIKIIDELKGEKPRICITCHGQKVHEVHAIKLKEGEIICDTCHKINGEITRPKAKEGMLLVCELCHAKGNYIEIHIEGNILKDAPIDEKWKKSSEVSNTCKICHFGELSFIHKNVLEKWREKIDNISIEKVEPLNISYL